MLSVGQARIRLEMMLQWQAAPALSSSEVDTLLAIAKRADTAGNPPDDYQDWKPATAYALNAQRVPTQRNGFLYTATTAGTSGAAEPVWPATPGATVNDGTVVWTNAGRAPWQPSFNLRAAAAEGWEWKAGKVVETYDVKAGSVEAKRNQQYVACMAKARQYRGGRVGSVETAVTLPFRGF